MLLSTGASDVVINSVFQAMNGIHDDSKRTTKVITGSIAEFMESRSFIKQAPVRAKRPGSFQLIQPQFPPKRTS